MALGATEIETDCAVLRMLAFPITSRNVKELASFFRRDLDCLYIVDHCIGRCGECGKAGSDIDKIAARTKDRLSKTLRFDEGDRSPMSSMEMGPRTVKFLLWRSLAGMRGARRS